MPFTGDRFASVDWLRGLALAGLLFTIVVPMGDPLPVLSGLAGTLDRLSRLVLDSVIGAKPVALLSVLLGWGAARGLRPQSPPGSIASHFRRAGTLLFLGMALSLLAWHMDLLILAGPALFLATPLLRVSRGRGMAVLYSCIGVVVLVGTYLYMQGTLSQPNLALEGPNQEASKLAFAHGSFWQMAEDRADLLDHLNLARTGLLASALAAFLGGVLLERTRGLPGGNRRSSRAGWTALGLVAVGVLASFLRVLSDPHWSILPEATALPIETVSILVGDPAFALGLALLAGSRSGRPACTKMPILTAIGRMPLTNYVIHISILSFYFYGYGLRAFHRVALPATLALLVLAIYLSGHLSRWWLGRKDLGPLEYLTRLVTYGWHRMIPPPERGLKRKAFLHLSRLAEWADRRWLGIAVGSWAVLLIWALGLAAVETRLGSIETNLGRFGNGETSSADFNDGAPNGEESIARIEASQNPLAVYEQVARNGSIVGPGELLSQINPGAILADLDALANQELGGRLSGTDGGRAAAAYIANLLSQYGFQAAGEGGTFYQEFLVYPLVEHRPPTLTIEPAEGNPSRIAAYQSFSPILGSYAGSGQASGPVLWGSDCTREDLRQLDAEGAILLCRRESDPAAPILARAAGVLLLEESAGVQAGQRLPGEESVLPEPIPTFVLDQEAAVSLLRGSAMSLAELRIRYEPLELPVRVHIDVSASPPPECGGSSCMARNVIGILPGRDPGAQDEIVLLLASYDGAGTGSDGQVWQGANHGASGVSVVLELARILQSSDLALRRTVVLAAVDASLFDNDGLRELAELPLLSRGHVVGGMYLGSMGGHGSKLSLAGERDMSSLVRALALQVGFLEVGTSNEGEVLDLLNSIGPAVKVDVASDEEGRTDRLTLQDTVESLEGSDLVRSVRLALLYLLNSAEFEPAVRATLGAREVALYERNRQSFLDTTHPDSVQDADSWFDGLIRSETRDIDLRFDSLVPSEKDLIAQVWQSYDMELENGILEKSAGTTTIRFGPGGDDWLWMGPDLLPVEPASIIQHFTSIRHGQDIDPEDAEAAAMVLDDQLHTALTVMGLTFDEPFDLTLYDSQDDLRMAMNPSLPRRANAANAPGVLGLVVPEGPEPDADILAGLYRGYLYQIGFDPRGAPWVWEGLPAVLTGRTRPLDVQKEYLATVLESLEGGEIDGQAGAWARIEYLRRRLGWRGLGRWLVGYGELCQASPGCSDDDALEPSLLASLGMDSAEFEVAWQAYWGVQYQRASAALDRLLEARQSAVLDARATAFAAGVSRDTPGLIDEQRHWFEAMSAHNIESFSLEGRPLALLHDGSVIGEVSIEYSLADVAGPTGRVSSTVEVLFTPTTSGLAWAGPPFDRTSPGTIQIFFPYGEHQAAQSLLRILEDSYPRILASLGLPADRLVVKLYPDNRTLIHHTALGISTNDPVPYAVARSEPFHIVLDASILRGDPSDLLPGLARHALVQSGVEPEWLLSALSITAADSVDGGNRAIENGRHQLGLQNWIESGLPYTLDALPPPEDFDSVSRMEALALDTLHFLRRRFGTMAFDTMLARAENGSSLESALMAATGLGLEEFTQAWTDSFLSGHLDAHSIEIAQGLDQDEILERMEPFLDPGLHGRRGGTRGARETIEWVGSQFAQFGLTPMSTDVDGQEAPIRSEDIVALGLSETAAPFADPYPIPYQALISAPRLQLQSEQSGWISSLNYREDYLLLSEPPPSGGEVQARILFVKDLELQHLDLTGWIVLVRPRGNPIDVVHRAFELGASGVLLQGEVNGETSQYERQLSVPTQDPLPGPALMLTYAGFRRILAFGDLTVGNLTDAPPVMPLHLLGTMSIPLLAAEEHLSANVLGVLPGVSPDLRDEVIIVGAHYDHVGDDPASIQCDFGQFGRSFACGSAPGARYPGANDNATGLSVMLTLAQLWSESGYRPGRTIVFAAWGDGELGDMGLNHFVQTSPYGQENIYGLFELDKLGAGEGFYVEALARWEAEGHLISALLSAERILNGRLKVTEGSGTGEHSLLSDLDIPSVIISRLDAEASDLPEFLSAEIDPDWLQAAARLVALAVMTLAE